MALQPNMALQLLKSFNVSVITFRTGLEAELHTYVHSYIHTYKHIHTYIHTYIHTSYIHTYVHSYIHTYIHTYIVAFTDDLRLAIRGETLSEVENFSNLELSKIIAWSKSN
jgi:hypothetical protein